MRGGSRRIDIRLYQDGRYGFEYTPHGQERVRVRCNNQGDAEARARDILSASAGGKVERFVDEDEYAEFLRWKAERGNGSKAPELVASFLASKADKGRSFHHVERLKNDLGSFAKEFTGRLDAISRADIEKWLNARKVGPRRWNNLREVIVALYRFARREGAVGAQLCGAELIERKHVDVDVETYTPAEMQALLDACPEEWLPLLVLGGFCGLRPMEICPSPREVESKPPLLWQNILWEKRKIDIPARVSKVRRRRFAVLTDPAFAFLDPIRSTGPLVPQKDMNKQARKIATAAGVQWKPNALRHSFASYRLALVKDTAALALEMGNSPSMIFKHYLDLKHEDEAEKWFALRPKSAKGAKTAITEVRTK